MYSEQYSTSQYSPEISVDSPHNSLGLRWHLACEPDVFEAYKPHNQEHVHACSTHSSLLGQRDDYVQKAQGLQWSTHTKSATGK